MSRPLADVEAKLKSLEAYSPNAAEFGDRHTEAVTAQKAVIEQMTMLAQQKRQQEVAPVELPAEQAEQDTVKLAGNKSMPECELTMRRIPALADTANGTDEDTARNINNCDMVHGFDSASGEGFSVFKVECNIMDTAKIMQFIAGFEGTKVTRLIN
jgi:hypothetical protein